MNLPISWVAAAAIPASQLAKQSASFAASSASHFFGDLLRPEPQLAANGLSVPTESKASQSPSKDLSDSKNDSLSWSDRLDSLRALLSKGVGVARSKFGLSSSSTKGDELSITSTGSGFPKVEGAEPIRTELENFLADQPELMEEIRRLANAQIASEPLRWLPTHGIPSDANAPLRIWVS